LRDSRRPLRGFHLTAVQQPRELPVAERSRSVFDDRFRPILLKNSLQRLRRFLRRESVKGRIGRRHAPERTHRLGEPLTV